MRYRFAELPDTVLDLVGAPVDAALADADFQVQGGATSRTVVAAPGAVNVKLTQSLGAGSLEFNFHRESAIAAELSEWLGRVQEFITLSDRLAAVLGVADVRREIHA